MALNSLKLLRALLICCTSLWAEDGSEPDATKTTCEADDKMVTSLLIGFELGLGCSSLVLCFKLKQNNPKVQNISLPFE